jgi:DNA polymerase-3 subunit epsilon
MTNSAAGFGSFTVVDIETTGLSAANHRVLSVAALAMEADGRVAAEFHTLLDPGCDPGPVHIHGLTRAKLRGSPTFSEVRERLSGVLTGRVMVAHNAHFDYGFLAGEFTRAGGELPVRERLCTLALARRVCPPTVNSKLSTLASYYGVPQANAHSALDDARVLVGVLRALMADAARLGITAPFLACPPKENLQSWHASSRASRPKVLCQFKYPGQMDAWGLLVQGMKVAFTGPTHVDRDDLAGQAQAAGLDVVGTVSSRTNVLVSNMKHPHSAKGEKAIELGTAIVDEARFLTLLAAVQPGTRKLPADQTRQRARSAKPKVAGPLLGRRVLVLGGTYDSAAVAREGIAGRGGSAPVNMSASVTDVLVLPGGESDRRYAKAVGLGLRIHDLEIDVLDSGSELALSPSGSHPAMVLTRGQVIDLPVSQLGTYWNLRATWAQAGNWDVDIVAFLLDGSDQTAGDEDFVFYNQPTAQGAWLTTDGPNEQSISVRLDNLPSHCGRIVFAAALDGAGVTFGDVGPIEIEAVPGADASPAARSTLGAATSERTLLLAELYLREGLWRLRSVGQGYETGLGALARGYGVDVDG